MKECEEFIERHQGGQGGEIISISNRNSAVYLYTKGSDPGLIYKFYRDSGINRGEQQSLLNHISAVCTVHRVRETLAIDSSQFLAVEIFDYEPGRVTLADIASRNQIDERIHKDLGSTVMAIIKRLETYPIDRQRFGLIKNEVPLFADHPSYLDAYVQRYFSRISPGLQERLREDLQSILNMRFRSEMVLEMAQFFPFDWNLGNLFLDSHGAIGVGSLPIMALGSIEQAIGCFAAQLPVIWADRFIAEAAHSFPINYAGVLFHEILAYLGILAFAFANDPGCDLSEATIWGFRFPILDRVRSRIEAIHA